jgi:hypothetical protein
MYLKDLSQIQESKKKEELVQNIVQGFEKMKENGP